MTETPSPPTSSPPPGEPVSSPPTGPVSSIPTGPVAGLLEMLRGSQMLRLLAIGVLVLLLQIPIAMIEGVIQERSWRRSEAVADVQAKWGGEQHVAGPRLVVPVTRTVEVAASSAWKASVRLEKSTLYVLPERLEVTSRLDTETLHRGIFDVPVYELALQLKGEFAPPDLAEFLAENDEVHWDRAALVIEISEARAVQRAAQLQWGDETLDFLPGGASATTTHPAIHVLLGERAKQGASFGLTLDLNGSEAFYLAAAGKDTNLAASSDWPHPSFQGAWLPSEREVSPDGFTAEWRVPNLGRGVPNAGVEGPQALEAMTRASFGLCLATPVDTYRIASPWGWPSVQPSTRPSSCC